MNKVIILSIQPQWLHKILTGKKTIEIRKSMPKCDYPIDVYLYCTKSKNYLVKEDNYETIEPLFNYKIDKRIPKVLFGAMRIRSSI